jgi:large subunit ribosomal protein L25
MAAIVIEAEPRAESGKGPNRRLRAAGRVPAVLYGGKKETVSLSVDPKEVVKIIRSHGGVNTIFELAVQGAKGKENVMIRDFQLEPVEHDLLHADLVRVAMDKKLILDVSVELIGTAIGVKLGGGMMDFITRSVEVSCLPKDIPETIVADVSELELGQYLRASELKLPNGVELVSDGNVVLAHVMAPKAEEEKPAEGVEGAEAPKADTPTEGGKED